MRFACASLAAAIVLSSLSGCSKSSSTIGVSPSKIETPDQALVRQNIVGATQSFGIDIFKTLDAGVSDSNLFISPLSMTMALLMTANGARGETQVEILHAIGCDNVSMDDANQVAQNMLNDFTTKSPSVCCQIANSIWYRNTFPVKHDFIATDSSYYNAAVKALDFTDPTAPAVINQWVSDNTNGKIPSIIDKIEDNDQLILLNAVYFKGQWALPFDSSATRNEPFYLADGTSKTCAMMRTDKPFAYYQDQHAQYVELDYDSSDFSMLLILPDSTQTATAFVQSMTPAGLDSIYAKLSVQEINLYLPQCKFSCMKDLVAALGKLGIQKAFVPGSANFMNITDDSSLFISKLQQKAFLKICEGGTEAAAVTIGVISDTSIGIMPPIMYINRPYICILREKTTNTILFIGKIMDPTAS